MRIHQNPRGYTLIELLVVIGVIAILMSLLIPQLSRVRTTARAMECSANLKSIAQWGLVYAESWDGVLPMNGSVHGLYWAVSLTTDFAQNYAADAGFRNSLVLSSTQVGNPWASSAYFKPLHCPESRILTPWLQNRTFSSYGLNSNLGGYNGGLGSPGPTYPNLPVIGPYMPRRNLLTSDKFWFGDGHYSLVGADYYQWGFMGGVYGPWMFPTGRPGGFSGNGELGHPNSACNYVFGDGHLEALNQAQVSTLTSTTSGSLAFNGSWSQ